MPDFKVQNQIDPTALASVMQRKSAMEQEQANADRAERNSRVSRILEAVVTGQQIASNMMSLAESRREAKGMRDASAILNEPAPTAKTSTLGEVEVKPSPEQEQSKQDRLRAALLQASGKAGALQMLKSQIPDTTSQKGRFQQAALEYKTPEGRSIPVATKFDTESGKHYNPVTGEEITSQEQLKGMLARGYAQSTRSAGYTADGEEVVADVRTGEKFTTSTDENGNKVNKPYNGTIYPKLENPPEGFTQAVAELGNSERVLKSIVESFDPKFVGPLSPIKNMTKYLDSLTDEKRVEFNGNVAEYKNSIIKAITGAQMSEIEARRIVQQIPDSNASPTAFMAGVKRAYDMTSRRIQEQEKAIKRSGGIVRGERDVAITEEDLTALIDKKLGRIGSSPKGSDPEADALAKVLGLKKKGK